MKKEEHKLYDKIVEAWDKLKEVNPDAAAFILREIDKTSKLPGQPR